MAVQEDTNIFLTSRVRDSPTVPEVVSSSSDLVSPLMTFADMILLVDKGIPTQTKHSEFCRRKADHTYASSRSSSLRKNETKETGTGRLSFPSPSCSNNNAANNNKQGSSRGESNLIKTLNRSQGEQTERQSVPGAKTRDKHRSKQTKMKNDRLDYRVKKSSSVENILPDNEAAAEVVPSEWPPHRFITSSMWQSHQHMNLPERTSPRKSSSFEAVNSDHCDPDIKPSKSTENVHQPKKAVLHRMVNNTLEFPYWPRKADHTYATATWDGTASSHSMFEQEMRDDQEMSENSMTEEQEMEIVVQTNLCSLESDMKEEVEKFPKPIHMPVLVLPEPCNFNISDSKDTSTVGIQREDHTYVKAKAVKAKTDLTTQNTKASAADNSTRSSPTVFSSATFPRQKPRDREDHTYFHSGMSRTRRGNSSSNISTTTSSDLSCNNFQSTADSSVSQRKQQTAPQSDEKSHKDHSYYSTSA